VRLAEMSSGRLAWASYWCQDWSQKNSVWGFAWNKCCQADCLLLRVKNVGIFIWQLYCCHACLFSTVGLHICCYILRVKHFWTIAAPLSLMI
jgi:hypothetical protein